MSRNLVFIPFLLLLLSPMVCLTFIFEIDVEATNGYPVHNLNTGMNYTTIQEAVDAANPGDTILVDAGVYYENVKVREALTILGENKTTTIVDGNENDHVFDIEAYSPIVVHNVTIRELTIRGGGDYEGIFLGHSCNSMIIDNIITDNEYGIWIHISSNNTIANNTIMSNLYHGISLSESSSNNVIANNTISNNGHCGIDMQGSSVMPISEGVTSHNNTIINNTVTLNAWWGIDIGFDCKHNTLRGNRLIGNVRGQLVVSGYVENLTLSDFIHDIDASNQANGKPIYYWVNKHKDQVPSDAGVVYLVNCTDITVESVNIENVRFVFTNSSVIANSSIVFEGNLAVFIHSHRNTVMNNSIMTTRSDWPSPLGISLLHSDNNLIACNTLKSTCNYAITPLSLRSSNGNKIYHNNFINCSSGSASNSANCLDNGYPSGGNYWLLRGLDSPGWDYNRDGLSDYTQGFDENNKDKYPLMGMFYSFKTQAGYQVDFVSNSTIDEFQYLASERIIKIHASKMILSQSYGFCRVCIPHALMDVSNISVIIDDGLTPVLYFNDTLYDNNTHRWIYFAYQHSKLKIVIIPEFPSFLILPLFMIATLLAVIVYKKRAKSDRYPREK